MIIRRFAKFVKHFSTSPHTLSRCLALKPPWKILFFGSDDFSLRSLEKLVHEYRKGNLISNLEVVTSLKTNANPVQKFTAKEQLNVHNWPYAFPEDSFHVGIVVSFGHLIPETVINKFPLGMLNVHASLLPRWRGAAPIVHALASGDTKTGVTIMRIRPHKFDVGEIVKQAEIEISEDMQMPELYDKLAQLGSNVLVDVVKSLPHILTTAKVQREEGVTLAPRIRPDFSRVQWNEMSSTQVYNLDRALKTLYPLQTSWNGVTVKLLDVVKTEGSSVSDGYTPGFVMFDKVNKVLKVLCADRKWICVKNVRVVGKPVMSAVDFNNGYINKLSKDRRYFT